ncbi:hypothetical protein OJ962_29980, partial [Solirubrobacter sp. CPCC 204708]
MFGLTAFELRYDRFGHVAVRCAGGDVMERHVEAEPAAAWMIEARCGAAAGWLLAPHAPADVAGARAWLEVEVARRTAAAWERHARALAALDADLIERLTHRLRTDVMTLGTVAEGALTGVFADESAEVAAELRRTSQEAQRRMTAAREVATVLAAGSTGAPERIDDTLRAELEGAGRDATVTVAADEAPWTRIGGAGWAAAARVLAAADRLAAFTIEPDEDGWRVTATAAGEGTAAGERGEAAAAPPGGMGGSGG